MEKNCIEKDCDYVSFKTASALKHLGKFDWATTSYYQGGHITSNELKHISQPCDDCDDCYCYLSCINFNDKDSYCNTHEDESVHQTSAPTLYMAQKWLREVKGIHITIIPRSHSQEKWQYRITYKNQELEVGVFIGEFNTYEEALDEAILSAIYGFFTRESEQRKGR